MLSEERPPSTAWPALRYETREWASRHEDGLAPRSQLRKHAEVVAAELGVALPNAYRPINRLVEAGILVEFTDQKRGRAWRAPEVLAALDSFAARAGRRGLAR